MRSTNALLLGIAIGAVAVGATTAVSANGGSSITACANKSTGAMRYVSKGSCKKTERKVTWNSQGPTGPQGVGTPGSNGQNLFAIDANGAKIGPIRGLDDGSAIVEYQNRLFRLVLDRTLTSGFGSFYINTYSDSSCTQPLISVYLSSLTVVAARNPQRVVLDAGLEQRWDKEDRMYVAVGEPMTFSGRNLYWSPEGDCEALSDAQKTSRDIDTRLFNVQEIQKPNYEAPISIVSQ